MEQRKLVGFLGYWVANAFVLVVAAAIFKGNVVLGNKDISGPFAAVVVGLIVVLLTYIVEPIIAKSNIKRSLKSLKLKEENLNGLIYFVVNVVIVWVLKLFASVLGMGISSVLYAVLVGGLLTLGQWAVYKTVPRK
ncbi:MAG: phage holin family protein [Candidatus Curtissbacteria bacterium]|nr:phage holin family protein [Candidatus Curtissbacteria bacterium]